MPHSLFLLVVLLAAAQASAATPRQLFLVSRPPITLTNHHGQLLTGNYSVNLLWYGRFTPAQRAVVADFILSLSGTGQGSGSVMGCRRCYRSRSNDDQQMGTRSSLLSAAPFSCTVSMCVFVVGLGCLADLLIIGE
uniref:Uncharacterized protein n=1 Tax=Zea mays TaxID=4577 RepID=B6TRY6_MAIZE|nr:hypothetical protein [Zea mays]